MDVIPIVAQEVVNRYHRERSNSSSDKSSNSKVTGKTSLITTTQTTNVPHSETSCESTHNGTNDGRAAVTVELASLLTRLWLYDKEYTMDVERNISSSAAEIERVVSSMADFLAGQCSIANLSLLSLQAQTHTLQKSMTSRKQAAKIKHEAITLRLVESILQKSANFNADEVESNHNGSSERTSTRPNSPRAKRIGHMSETTNNKVVVDELLGDITLYILHRYHQLQNEQRKTTTNNNTATDQANLSSHKATASVLCGILPRKQVLKFMLESRVEKQRQLEEFSKIVWGIRVYRAHQPDNEEVVSSYAGVVNVPSLLSERVLHYNSEITLHLCTISERVNKTLLVLELPTNGLNETEMQRLREEYHHLLQIKFNLLALQCKFNTLQQRIERFLLIKFDEQILNIDHMLSSESSAPSISFSPASGMLQQRQQETQHEQLSMKNNETLGVHENALVMKNNKMHTGPMLAQNKANTVVAKRAIYPLFMTLADAYEAAVRCCDEFEEIDTLLTLNINSSNTYESFLPELKAAEAVAQYKTQRMRVNKLQTSKLQHTLNKGNNSNNTIETFAIGTTNLVQKESLYPNAARNTTGMDDVESLLVKAQHKLKPYSLFIAYTQHLPQTMNEQLAKYFPHSLFALNGCCLVTLFTEHLLVEGDVYTHNMKKINHGKEENSDIDITKRTETNRSESVEAEEKSEINAIIESEVGYLVLSGGVRFSRLLLPRPMYLAFRDMRALKTFLRTPVEFILPLFESNKWGEPGLLLLAGLDELLPHELYITGARDVTLMKNNVLTNSSSNNNINNNIESKNNDNKELWNQIKNENESDLSENVNKLRQHTDITNENLNEWAISDAVGVNINDSNNSICVSSNQEKRNTMIMLAQDTNELLDHAYSTSSKSHSDANTQTGQINSYIDHNYRWNEWDLRRQALKLANLIQMKTRSTQTKESHFKQEVAIQVNERKEQSMQTMRDAAVQPDITVQYLKGLRGTTDSAITQIQQSICYES